MGAVYAIRGVGHHRTIHDGRRAFDLFPGGGRSYLYAVGFEDGRVKLGHAFNVRKRVNQHWRSVDGRVLWAHVFGPVVVDERARCQQESKALNEAAKRGERIGHSEFFRGLSKADALICGRIGMACKPTEVA